MMAFHEGSISKALMDLFPDIGLEEPLLQAHKSIFLVYFFLCICFAFFVSFFNILLAVWKSAENRRNFFEKYAKKKGFDPLDPEPWYNQSKEDILAAVNIFFPSHFPSLPSLPISLSSHLF